MNNYKLKDIRDIVRDKNVNRTTLENSLSVDQPTLSRILRGEVWINDFKVSVICRILKVPRDTIVDIVDENRSKTIHKRNSLRCFVNSKRRYISEEEYKSFMQDIGELDVDGLEQLEKNVKEVVRLSEKNEISLDREYNNGGVFFNNYRLRDIRYLFEENEIDKKQVQKDLHICQNTLNATIRGEKWTDKEKVDYFCKILDVPKEYIVEEQNDNRYEDTNKRNSLRCLINVKKSYFTEDEYKELNYKIKNCEYKDIENLERYIKEITTKIDEDYKEYKKNKELIAHKHNIDILRTTKEKLKKEEDIEYNRYVKIYGDTVKLKGMVFEISRNKQMDLTILSSMTGITIDNLVKYQARYDCPLRDALKIRKSLGVEISKIIHPEIIEKRLDYRLFISIFQYAKLLYNEYRSGSLIYDWDYAWARACCANAVNLYLRTPPANTVF